eukprot:gene3022-5806_t
MASGGDGGRSIRQTKTKRDSVINIFNDGTQAITMADGSKYIGEWKDGKFHGNGELVSADGTRYKGEFHDGKLDGEGVLETKSGTYTGTLKDNKMHGRGTFLGSDGSHYVGTYVNGEKSGVGELKQADGSIYTGQFKPLVMVSLPMVKADMKHGEGKLVGGDKSVYEGEWRSNKRHGEGKITFSDGTSYIGSWEDDLFHGKGTLKRTDSIYEGTFVNGVAFGEGTLKCANGDVYCGELKNNKPSGKGTLSYADDVGKYSGDFEDGQRHGIGEFSCTDPHYVPFMYNGEWKHDERHGTGTLSFQGDFSYTGQFEKGRPVKGKFQKGDKEAEYYDDPKFAKFLGEGSNPAGWETHLLGSILSSRGGPSHGDVIYSRHQEQLINSAFEGTLKHRFKRVFKMTSYIENIIDAIRLEMLRNLFH